MSKAVIKSAAYSLIHTPDMIIHNGTTQTTEKIVNPDSEYLVNLHKSIRSYEDVVNYAPNQTYIGNIDYKELKELGFPWVGKDVEKADRVGRFGEILPQVEFLAMLKLSDVFDLVLLETDFNFIKVYIA